MEESLRYASEIDSHFAMDETEPTVRLIFVSSKLLTSSRQVDIIYHWGYEVLRSVVWPFLLTGTQVFVQQNAETRPGG